MITPTSTPSFRPSFPNRFFLSIGLAVLFSVYSFPASAFKLQELTSPPNTTLSWVGKDLVQNGMPIQIMQFESALSVAELRRFYQHEWQSLHAVGETSVSEREMNGWLVWSTLLEGHHVVVQVLPNAGGSAGFISATPLDVPPMQSQLAERFPRQWGTDLVSTTEAIDAGVKATTLVLSNKSSIDSNADFYRHEMVRRGWSITHDVFQRETAVLFFDHPGKSLELAISSEGEGAMIFINLREGS